MNLKEWYLLRGSKFVVQRGSKLLHRYSLGPSNAMRRIDRLTATLVAHGCKPTFPTPGTVVQSHPDFIRNLQNEGAEIAVHGYLHVDLNTYPLAEAMKQLEKAARTFERSGIDVYGFRCPYVSCSEELLNYLPNGLFNYSSNMAIRWDPLYSENAMLVNTLYDKINIFYGAKAASDTICVPRKLSNLTEIPLCIPDDLQLYDGLQLSVEDITQTWKHILHQTHQRGELFTLLFHTELAAMCEQPFVEILNEARELHPPVWIACLRDISAWWLEKSKFRVDVVPSSNGLHLSFNCSPRATILATGLGQLGSESLWNGTYYRLPNEEVEVPAEPRPFVGLQDGTPERVLSFLQDQGYILDTGDTASNCGIFLDSSVLSRLTSQVQLIDYIETSSAPLIRYWRWPDGARSALSITGDLDALSLLDYASRLFMR